MRTITGRVVARTVLGAAGLLTAVAVVGCSGGTATFTGSATPNGSVATNPAGASTTVVGPPTQTYTATTDATSATTSRGAPATVARSATPECGPASLKLSFGGGDAGMSQQHEALRFTNVGRGSCVIVGFPGVSYVAGDKGTQVGAPAVRSGKIGAQITLKPGQVASTIISSVEVGVFDAKVCRPTPVRGYRIYPPDSTASMFIALPGGVRGCAGSPPDPQLSVVSITRGPGNVG